MTRTHIKPHVERAVFGFGLVHPVLALPQVYKVWFLGAVGGLSLISLSAGLVMAVLMVAWGLIERSAALWAPSLVWVGVNIALITGIVRFT